MCSLTLMFCVSVHTKNSIDLDLLFFYMIRNHDQVLCFVIVDIDLVKYVILEPSIFFNM